MRMRQKLSAMVAFAAILTTGASAHAASVIAGFTDMQVTSGLARPTAMAFAPDNRIFVTEQRGTLRVVKEGNLLATPFVNLTVDSSGERGLLGVAFDPAFGSNKFVYVYHTVPGSRAHNRVTRFTAAGDRAVPGSGRVILDLNPLSSATNHNGGAIHFGRDGKLYVFVGENGNGANAQSLSNRLGKVLRINKDGSIPGDNPRSFPGIGGQTTGLNRSIWAVGLRNPFTAAFQPGSGKLYINDVGQSTYEEINRGIRGANYGWPASEGPTSNRNFTGPVHVVAHSDGSSCAITGGAFYNPAVTQYPDSFIGAYFYSDLCGGWIHYLTASGDARPFATGITQPVDMEVGDGGMLNYLSRTGEIRRIRYTR